MSAHPDWIEHRRSDGELVGWISPVGDDFVAIDLLGRERTSAVDWLTAEETLDRLGIGYLAEPAAHRARGGVPHAGHPAPLLGLTEATSSR